MTAILDYCVPSRRRERQERKEHLALASRVNSRWGDTQITAPSEGGWNQPGYFIDQENDLPALPGLSGSPHNSGSSVSTTPDLSVIYDKAIEAGITIENKAEGVVQLPQAKEERKNISFTITLPWPRRVNSPPMGGTQPMNIPPQRSEPAGTISRPSTAQSTATAAYIPASDRYMKDLASMGKSSGFMNPLAQSPPDRPVETFPVGMHATVPDSYVQDVADLGLVPSPPPFRGPSPGEHGAIDPVVRRGRSPPLQHPSPIMRLEPIPATPYCMDNFSDDDRRMERPEAAIPSHPAVTNVRSRARSHSREPHSDRHARMRSSSRGPAESRCGTVRPPSRGAAEDRSSAIRSSSRSPAEDRIGTTRSSSRGPAPDRVASPPFSSEDAGLNRLSPVRSSSRGPPADRFGTVRSSSRGPTSDRVGTVRSSSRGPALDRVGRGRSSSLGPPAGRIAMVRSASREPMADRLPYNRASRRDSTSSDSSAATVFSDVEGEKVEKVEKATKHHRAPSTSIPSPNGVGHVAVDQIANAKNASYYSSLASEHRMIPKDVETQTLYETDSSEGKAHKKKKVKDRMKDTYSEPQTLVPSATELYG